MSDGKPVGIKNHSTIKRAGRRARKGWKRTPAEKDVVEGSRERNAEKRPAVLQELLGRVAEEQARLQRAIRDFESNHPGPAQHLVNLVKGYEALLSAQEALAIAEEKIHQQNEQLQAAMKTVESEHRRYQQLFEFDTDAHIVTDAEGIICEANLRATRLLNTSREILTGKSLLAFISKKDRKAYHNHLMHLKQGGRLSEWEVTLKPRRKGSFPAAVIATPFVETNEPSVSIHWLISDITNKTEMQKELLQKTILFERVVNCSAVGIFAFDRDCRYTLWNPTLEQLTGISKDVVLGQCAFDVFTFLKLTGEDRCYWDTLSGKTFSVEMRRFRSPLTGRIVSFDAQYSPLRDVSGAVVGGLVVIRDITKRTKAEAALRHSEEKYRNLFENSAVGIFTVDLHGCYTSINPAALNAIRYSLEEVVGKSYREHVAPEAIEKVVRDYRRMYETGRPLQNVQYDVIAKSGERITIESNVNILMSDGEPVGAQATAIDVTKRKQTEETQRLIDLFLQVANQHSEMEPLLNKFVHLIQEFTGCEAVGIRVIGPGRRRLGQAYAGFSEEFFESSCPLSTVDESCLCRLSTRSSKGILSVGKGKKSPHLPDADKLDSPLPCKSEGYQSVAMIPIRIERRKVGIIQVADRTHDAIRDREMKILEQAVPHIATAIVRIQMNETVRQALHVSSKRASEISALLESSKAVLEHQKFAKAAETIVSSCKNLVGASAACITINNEMERNREEVIAVKCLDRAIEKRIRSRHDLYGPRAAVYRSAKPMYANYLDRNSDQARLFRRKVAVQNFLLSPILLDGEVAGLLILFNKSDGFCDEDKHLADAFAGQAAVALRNSKHLEALQRSEARYRWLSEGLENLVRKKLEELQQAKTLASIGQMVSVVAHEIRNPLQNIYMGVDSLRSETDKDSPKMEILDEITYGVGTLNGIVQELLNYSKPVTLSFSAWTGGEIINNALNMVSERLRHVTIRTNLEESKRKFVVDAEKISQVLVNLLTNAADAMPNGGRLTVSSKVCDFEGVNCLKLSVSDTGCGMDGEHLARLEDPFFTTKTHGTGLGISICRKIVLAHNGTLKISSEKNRGTTVEVFLPVRRESV